MWETSKQAFGLLQQVLTLAKDMERMQGDIKDLKKDLLAFTHLVERLINKIEMGAQKEESARKIFEYEMKEKMQALFDEKVEKLEKSYAQQQAPPPPVLPPALLVDGKKPRKKLSSGRSGGE